MKKPKISSVCLHMLLAAFPIGFKSPPGDSSGTNIEISFGHGNYASIVQGCEDTEPSDKDQLTFTDFGLQVDHLVTSHFRLGIRGSYIRDQRIIGDLTEPIDVTIINPFVNFEWRTGAIGVGYIFTEGGIADYERDDRLNPRVSFLLRLGSPNSLYFRTSLFSSVPVYSKAYFQLVFGGRPNPRLNLWAGFGSGPYAATQGAGLIGIGGVGIDLNRYLTLSLSGGIGSVEGIGQNALNVGLKVRIPR